MDFEQDDVEVGAFGALRRQEFVSTYCLSGRLPGARDISWWQPMVPEWGILSVREQAEAAGYEVEIVEETYSPGLDPSKKKGIPDWWYRRA